MAASRRGEAGDGGSRRERLARACGSGRRRLGGRRRHRASLRLSCARRSLGPWRLVSITGGANPAASRQADRRHHLTTRTATWRRRSNPIGSGRPIRERPRRNNWPSARGATPAYFGTYTHRREGRHRDPSSSGTTRQRRGGLRPQVRARSTAATGSSSRRSAARTRRFS